MKKICILSGKGGVGKTTVAVNIALRLRELGYKVGIMDADIDTPNVPQIADLPLEYRIKIDHDNLLPYDWNGIGVISLAWTMPENTPILWDDSQKQEAVDQIIRLTKWENLDYLIVDCPAGTGGELYSVLQSEMVGGVIVTTPHAAAVADAKRTKEALIEYKTPLIGIINNMSYYKTFCKTCGDEQYIKFSDKEDWNRGELLGSLPYSNDILLTNRTLLINPIVEKILNRIPKLKKVEHYTNRIGNIKRAMTKFAIKKTS